MIKSSTNQDNHPILIIEDDIEWANQLFETLQLLGFDRIKILSDPGFSKQLTGEFKPMSIFLGQPLASREQCALIDELKETYPNLPLIVISESTDVDMVVNCMRHGADDYLTRPLRRSELQDSLQRVQRNLAVHANDQHMDFEEAIEHVDELPDLKEVPDVLIEEALKRHNGVLKDAAEELGVSPQAICNRRRRHQQSEQAVN